MNYYPFHIGDYSSATRHLSWDEDIAYRRLIDSYYMREGPLPSDHKEIFRLVSASNKVQRAAVDSVLREFFVREADGYRNVRCDEEIEEFRARKSKARSSAATRWKSKLAMRSQCEGNARDDVVAMRSQCEGNASLVCEGNAPNPNPNPNSSSSGGVVARAREQIPDLEVRLREAAGWQSEPAPGLFVTGPIEALIDSGADVELDVLPVIKALAPKAQAASWRYFVKAIARARDQRIEAATIVTEPTNQRFSTNASHRRKPSRAETFDAIDRRIEQLREAERRETGSGETGHENPDEGAA